MPQSKSPQDVVIVGAARTPIAKFLGGLSSLTAPQLGAVAIKAALERAQIPGADVSEVVMGQVLSGGVGQAPARQASLAAGVPVEVPCSTINKVCGSGLYAVTLAARAIGCGDSTIAVAGGQESMSNAPYIMPRAREGFRMGHAQVIDSMIHDGLWDPHNDFHMGNAGELCADECGFGRSAQDEYAVESYRRARAAQVAGAFDAEITPVEIPQRKGDPIVLSQDEEPGAAPLEKLPKLRPAFKKDGTVTAGNASSINDGAAAVVITTREEAEKRGLAIRARILGWGGAAQAPEWFTTAPAPAIQNTVARLGMQPSDIDLYEINEAFSVVTLAVMDKVGIEHEKVNVNGGAVALGHPIGASGTRLLVTLLHALEQRDLSTGLATLCLGGGEAWALAIEREA